MPESIPFHIWLVFFIIGGSILLCLVAALAGAYWQRRASALPPVPLFPGSSFPGVFVQFYTAFFAITFGMAAAMGSMQTPDADTAKENEFLNLLVNAAMQIAMYLPLVIIYFMQPRRHFAPVSLLRRFFWIIMGLGALIIPAQILELAGLNQWIIETTGCPPLQDVVTAISDGDMASRIAMVVMAVIVAPITEECYFRGCVYNVMKQYSGRAIACFTSALLFSAVHASLAQLVPLFIFGLVQCVAYEKAKSLWLPIVLHMLFNAMSCTVILLS